MYFIEAQRCSVSMRFYVHYTKKLQTDAEKYMSWIIYTVCETLNSNSICCETMYSKQHMLKAPTALFAIDLQKFTSLSQ